MKKILISKDAFRKKDIGVYGSKIWKTPNIDELAKKGTIFNRHYTAASSSAMSYSSMFSGKYAHEFDRKRYEEVKDITNNTLFTIFDDQEIVCHILWSDSWQKDIPPLTKIYSKNTQFHHFKFEQKCGISKIDTSKIKPDTAIHVLQELVKMVDEILERRNDNLFLWVHFPQILLGKTCYSSDIEEFDDFVGMMRKRYLDDEIYISSDHGHMNCSKGIPVYGFHLYEPTINVPLITPRIDNQKEINFPTSHVQLNDIIIHNKLIQQEFIFCDTQYYKQENRKFCVIKNNYKYIYNKRNKTEELYDLAFDPDENVNLLQKIIEDFGRNKYYYLNEVYYYPHWDDLKTVYLELKNQKDKIWKEGNAIEELFYKINTYRVKFQNKLNSWSKSGFKHGRFHSKPAVQVYER